MNSGFIMSMANKTVLVVDDQAPFLRLFSKFFDSSFRVLTASSGTEALQVIKDNPDIDTVVMDVMMPGMNGFETCKKIRESHTMFELPLLFLTARHDIADISEGFESGGNDFLTKPFEGVELIARVETLVKLKKLYSSNRKLHNKLDDMNKFLQMNIHDLKNPLSAIMVLANMVKSEDDINDDNRKSLDIIGSSADYMLKLVNQILDLAYLESDNVDLKKEEVDLNCIIAQVVDMNLPLASSKGQHIKCSYIASKPCVIKTDPEKVFSAINNLVSNAVKYSPVQKNIEAKVEMINKDEKNFVRIEICDEGPGFSSEDKVRLFDKFTKLSARPTAGEHSTGLGLAITKQFVEVSGGEIYLDSQYTKGSKFIVDLPTE